MIEKLEKELKTKMGERQQLVEQYQKLQNDLKNVENRILVLNGSVSTLEGLIINIKNDDVKLEEVKELKEN